MTRMIPMSAEPTLEQFLDFEEKFGYTMINAAEVYVKRMRKASKIALKKGSPGPAQAFTEAADEAQRACDAWRLIVEGPEEPGDCTHAGSAPCHYHGKHIEWRNKRF